MNAIKYYKPKTLSEAQSLLLEFKQGARILNGGTFIVPQVKRGCNSLKALVDIKGIEELRKICFSEEEGLYIGATMTLSEIAHHKDVVQNYSVLADALESVGSGQIRNRATLIGNNCTGLPTADTSTTLLALDASFLVYADGDVVSVPAVSFYKGGKKQGLSESDIVIGVKIPPYKNIKGVFSKISRRKEFDIAIINSTVVKIKGKYRVAVGNGAPTPIRLYGVEEYLNNNPITEEICKQAGKLASKQCSPVDDSMGSVAYKLEMIQTQIKRSIMALNDLEGL
ncbi:MAG: xanthine dehydrogenase family protein subunit M [Cellulosilyticaceae bacterium]